MKIKEIRHDRGYIRRDVSRYNAHEIQYVIVCFNTEDEKDEFLKPIDEMYKIFQYKNKELKFGEHELFLNSSYDHFRMKINKLLPTSKRREIVKFITDYIENTDFKADYTIVLQYSDVIVMENIVEDFNKIDLDNINDNDLKVVREVFNFGIDWRDYGAEVDCLYKGVKHGVFKKFEGKKIKMFSDSEYIEGTILKYEVLNKRFYFKKAYSKSSRPSWIWDDEIASIVEIEKFSRNKK